MIIRDLLSLALADYHVFSRESGFGRVAAWLAAGLGGGRRDTDSRMHSFSQKALRAGQVHASCGEGTADSRKDSANQWTGIRY